MLELLKSRRSIRKFTDEKISKEDVEKIIKTGLLAPSSKSKYSVELILLDDTDKINDLPTCTAHVTLPL